MARSYGCNNRDWDPMQEDYNNSNYESQYPDDNSSDGVKLDHCRLYIRNIPVGLTDSGLESVFEKFGTLTEVFLSKDPDKRYGIVAFERPAEARHAMASLNKTEPLGLLINIAHERKVKGVSQNRNPEHGTRERESYSTRERENNSNRERQSSAVSKRSNRERDESSNSNRWQNNANRKTDNMATGDNLVPLEDIQADLGDDLSIDTMDPDLLLELERLEIERLKLQQAQLACKQRMLIKQAKRGQTVTQAQVQPQSASRCVLPDGKIMLRNTPDNSNQNRDVDGSFSAGAGDSLKIPALQRGARSCVACGAPADAHCARCGVTPYCSTACQRRDWQGRHQSVCHNLARMNAPLDVEGAPEVETNIPAPAPLRQPRENVQRDDDSGSDRGIKKFAPPGNSVLKSGQAQRSPNTRTFNKPSQGDRPYNADRPNNRSFDNAEKPNRSFDNSDRQNKNFENAERPNRSFDNNAERPNRSFDNADRPKFDKFNNRQNQDGGRPPLRKPQAVQDNERPGQFYRQPKFRRPQYTNTCDDDEDWDSPSYRNSQPSQQTWQNQQNQQQHKGSWLDRKRQINRRQYNNDNETWGAANPEPVKEEPKPAPVKETPLVRANRAQPSPSAANQRETPTANQNAVKSPAANQNAVKTPAPAVRPPASAADSTPARKLIPKNCLIEKLSKGEVVVLTVDRPASEGHTDSTGFLCTSLNENYEADYAALCDDYGVACEAEAPYKPAIGETFSYFDATDGGWYRARCLTQQHCALLDGSKVAPLAGARTVALPSKFEHQPEFTTLLQAPVKVGDSLRCTLLEKTANGWHVEVMDAESGARVGEGEVARWLPTVQYPAPVKASTAPSNPATQSAASAPAIPEVDRPDVRNNSTVLMVHVTDASNIFVRPGGADEIRAFDTVLHAVAQHGLNATPLTEPPTAGSYVISKYTDDIHYRALVKRTSVKMNKYLLEYIEYGNSHVNKLENLYALPANLHPATVGPMTSRVSLAMTSQRALTPPAEEYLDMLKDGELPLLLTIPGGAKTAPSGSEVVLTVASKNENVNKKLQEMCTPEWELLQQKGGDVVEVANLMYENVEFLTLPTAPCKLLVTDVSDFNEGTISIAPDMPELFEKLAKVTDMMAKYCESELGRDPYLPKMEELCIAQMPPYPQWFRAVFANHKVGEPEADVCYIDYGNMTRVPVGLVRKMMPEFMRGLPAIANTAEIKDFPKKLTGEMIERALQYLNIDDEGRGTITVTSYRKEGPGLYTIEAPELLRAMLGGN